MSGDIKESERRIEEISVENEELDQELTREQKKAAIREAKRMYGRDWEKMIGGALSKVKVNREALQNLHSLGVGDPTLREYNDPRFLRRTR